MIRSSVSSGHVHANIHTCVTEAVPWGSNSSPSIITYLWLHRFWLLTVILEYTACTAQNCIINFHKRALHWLIAQVTWSSDTGNQCWQTVIMTKIYYIYLFDVEKTVIFIILVCWIYLDHYSYFYITIKKTPCMKCTSELAPRILRYFTTSSNYALQGI